MPGVDGAGSPQLSRQMWQGPWCDQGREKSVNKRCAPVSFSDHTPPRALSPLAQITSTSLSPSEPWVVAEVAQQAGKEWTSHSADEPQNGCEDQGPCPRPATQPGVLPRGGWSCGSGRAKRRWGQSEDSVWA